MVCADDFGLTDAASQSIATLSAAGAITATSCIVDGEFASRYANALRYSNSNLSVGLHFNLTELTASSLQKSLRGWLIDSFVVRSVDRRAVTLELTRQLDAFEKLFKSPPQFVDGHEHVHQFPVVRDALIDVLSSRYGAQVAVRSTVPRAWRSAKAQIIAALGGRALQRRLKSRGLNTNRDFAGVYNFTRTTPYELRMQNWLNTIADCGLIMCHPEMPSAQSAVVCARADEHEYFASTRWTQQREAMGITLIPFTSASLQP